MTESEDDVLRYLERVGAGHPFDWDELQVLAGDSIPAERLRRLLELAIENAQTRDTETTLIPDEIQQIDEGDPAPRFPARRPADNSELPPTWGPLEIRRRLGAGSFGEVFVAWDSRLQRAVALKLYRRGFERMGSDAETTRNQLLHEGRMLARMRHPNIATVHGAEEIDGRVGIWMDYIQGHNLEELLRDQGTMGAHEAIGIGLDLCRALAEVHGRGLVHQDVKCQNVIRERGGRIVLMDFGLGVELPEGGSITIPGTAGTPVYMAPEALLSGLVSPGSDIYSLGVLLFHLLTGRYPVDAPNAFGLRSAHQTGARLLLRDLRPDLPKTLIDVIEQSMAPDPATRYRTMGELESALSLALGAKAPSTSPPLASAGSAIPNNLPVQISRFVGRRQALHGAGALLSESRVLTITGSGGIGKTRLAVEIAREHLGEFPDGVWYVELAALQDPTLVPQTTAITMGLKERAQSTWTDIVSGHLRDRTALLILDNAEHLLAACADLVRTLLRSCAGLHVLITSREPVHIAGEKLYQLSSLGVPAREATTVAELRQSEAAELLIDRAESMDPGFVITPEIVPALTQICRRLDGIPFALELAAARVRAMSIPTIAQRLDQRFRLLTTGPRSEMPHHQTLRALIDWSYEQLDPSQQAVLRYVSTFKGGWTLEAAEVACSAAGIEDWDVIDLLSQLVDKSLVETDREGKRAGVVRYSLLETVREYAGELLQADPHRVAVEAAHRDHYISLGEAADEELSGPNQEQWTGTVEAELDNIRSALDRCRAERDPEEKGLQLIGALTPFWHLRGYWTEGRRRCEEFLAFGADSRSTTRARALRCAGQLAAAQGEYERARSWLEEGLLLYRELDDASGVAWTCTELGESALQRREFATASTLFEESLATFRSLGDRRGVAVSLRNLGVIAVAHHDLEQARSRYEESLETQRELGNRVGIANVLNNLGNVARDQGDLALAGRRYAESLTLQRELGNRFGIAATLNNLGVVSTGLGSLADARTYYEESLACLKELGHRAGVAQVLHNLGDVSHAMGDRTEALRYYREGASVRLEIGDRHGVLSSLTGVSQVALDGQDWRMAARFLGAIRTYRPDMERPLSDEERAFQEKADLLLREHAPRQELAKWLEEGAALTLEEAVKESGEADGA